VVAGEDNTGFAGMAGAEMGGRVGADVVEVDSGVADRHHGAEGAERLAYDEADAGVQGCCRCEKHGADESDAGLGRGTEEHPGLFGCTNEEVG